MPKEDTLVNILNVYIGGRIIINTFFDPISYKKI